jgi:hypothetical protein
MLIIATCYEKNTLIDTFVQGLSNNKDKKHFCTEPPFVKQFFFNLFYDENFIEWFVSSKFNFPLDLCIPLVHSKNTNHFYEFIAMWDIKFNFMLLTNGIRNIVKAQTISNISHKLQKMFTTSGLLIQSLLRYSLNLYNLSIATKTQVMNKRVPYLDRLVISSS